MDQHIHDPKTKIMIKDALCHALYDGVRKEFHDRITDLILKNTLALHSGHRSFMYKNQFYNSENTIPLVKNRLLPQFKPVMDQYLKDLSELNDNELTHVIGYINQVLNSSNQFGDYLRLLPESLHPVIHRMASYYPCHNKKLSEDKVITLQQKNQKPIEMIKVRLAQNLLY